MTMIRSIKEMYNCCERKAEMILCQAIEIDNADELKRMIKEFEDEKEQEHEFGLRQRN